MYCPSCRGEYREGFSWCQDCETALVEILPDISDELEDRFPIDAVAEDGADLDEEADLPPEAPEIPRVPAIPAPRLRALELILVLSVTFGNSILSSLVDWLSDKTASPSHASNITELYRIFGSLSSLALLVYVLFRQGRNLRQLGLTAERSDVPMTLALTALGFAPYILVGVLQRGTYGGPAAHPWTSFLGSLESGPLTILALLLGAAREELIVRAYLMTEVAELTGRMTLAILASTVFQTLYHLYQGTYEALLAGVCFLIVAIYYAHTRRITPVVLSHFLYNLLNMGFRAAH
jgi:membrane protease YdiL (CAAX protease family)